MTSPRIALLGTGIMGGHVARRLAQAGYDVVAWNRSLDKVTPLLVHGVQAATSPQAAATACDVLISFLVDWPSTQAVLFHGGAVAAMAPNGVVVNMATMTMQTGQQAAALTQALGRAYLDAPVSGGETGARDGSMAIMVGGAQADLDRVAAILAVLGRPTLVGAAGAGQLAKLCNQMIVGNTIAAVAEALALAAAGGANPAAVREALLGGFADSRILREHGQRMVSGQFKPGGPAAYQLRDLTHACTLAEQFGQTPRLTRAAEALFQTLCDQGGSGLDHSAVYSLLRPDSP